VSSGANFQHGLALIGGQRYDDAIASLKRSIELEPRFFVPSLALAYLYEKLGRAQEALALLDRPEFRPSAYLATAYARLGRRTEALAMLRELGGPKGISDRRSIALAYFALGVNDTGFKWLKEAFEQREQYMRYLKSDFVYEQRPLGPALHSSRQTVENARISSPFTNQLIRRSVVNPRSGPPFHFHTESIIALGDTVSVLPDVYSAGMLDHH
jgi:tetratricopeptide (TPR) repeat protein